MTNHVYINHGYVRKYFPDWDRLSHKRVSVRVQVDGSMIDQLPRDCIIKPTRALKPNFRVIRLHGRDEPPLHGYFHRGWRLVEDANTSYLVLVASKTCSPQMAHPHVRSTHKVGNSYTLLKDEVAHFFPSTQAVPPNYDAVKFGLLVEVDGVVSEQYVCRLSHKKGTTYIVGVSVSARYRGMHNLGYVALPDKDGRAQLKVVLSSTDMERLPLPSIHEQQARGSGVAAGATADGDSAAAAGAGAAATAAADAAGGGAAAPAAGGLPPARAACVQGRAHLSCLGQQCSGAAAAAAGSSMLSPLMAVPKDCLMHVHAPLPGVIQAACPGAAGSVTGGQVPKQEGVKDTATWPQAPITARGPAAHAAVAAGETTGNAAAGAAGAAAGRKRTRAEMKDCQVRDALAAAVVGAKQTPAAAAAAVGQQVQSAQGQLADDRQEGAEAAGWQAGRSNGRRVAAESAPREQQPTSSAETAPDSTALGLDALRVREEQVGLNS